MHDKPEVFVLRGDSSKGVECQDARLPALRVYCGSGYQCGDQHTKGRDAAFSERGQL